MRRPFGEADRSPPNPMATLRFDGSDLMPPEVGLTPFWSAMMDYVANGPDNLDDVLAGLDDAWPDQ